MKKIILIIFCLVVSACSKEGDSRLAERSEIEAGAQIKAEEGRASKIVDDLIYQSQFYNKIYGEYEGEINQGNGPVVFRIKLFPRHPVFIPENRKLSVREAEEMLIKQSFNVQTIVVYDPEGTGGSFGCQFEAIKGDLVRGQINLLSEECGYVFNLSVKDPDFSNGKSVRERYSTAVGGASSEFSKKILSDSVDEVTEILGAARPALRDVVFYFQLQRVR